ncbi:MAG: hypothetical protein J7K73_00625 [Nanoarchaeota archaeon]|nr:hypothetical protein [Nanoarchaeota archaeon]
MAIKIFGRYSLNMEDNPKVGEVVEGKMSIYNSEAKVGPKDVGLNVGRIPYAIARGQKVSIEDIVETKMPTTGARVTHSYSPIGNIYRLMRDIMENPEKYKQR